MTAIQPKLEKKEKKNKKDKKKKKSVEKDVEPSVELKPESETINEKKNRKKSKEEANNIDIPLDKEEKKARKKLKKEKKRKLKELKESSLPVEESNADDANKSKKCKSNPNGPYQQPPPSDGSFKKSFYVESANVAKISEKELAEYHEREQMTISGENCLYKPILSFSDTGFESSIMKSVEGFEKPTPIQSQCWPILASGRDIIGIAETGSGKTLAFTLPGLIHIKDQKPVSSKSQGPIMLVVAPTRELAMQSSDVISKVGSYCNVKSLCIYGGVPKNDQRKKLKNGVHVVVATPGRLKDLMNESSCDLSRVTYLVLDEADRMLDEGFEKDIRTIIGGTHPERQIAMFSATWPDSVKKLAHEFLSDPVKVTIGSDDLAASRNVTQIVEVVEDRSRDHKIDLLLQKYHATRKNRILIFVLYKKEASRVERSLRNRGWNCVAIHGDKNQYERTEAVEKFKKGVTPLLIATDVAARGLDIPGVEYVINYAFPLTIEDYVHRIGRTGRGGKKGTAHTFFTAFDKPRAGELVNVLREAEQKVPEDLMKFGTHVKKKEHKLYGAFTKNIDMSKKATKITFDSDDE